MNDESSMLTEVVEDLVSRGEVRARAATVPLHRPGGEHPVRLVQTDERIGVIPHPAAPRAALHEDDPLSLLEIAARDHERVQRRDPRSDHTEICTDTGHRRAHRSPAPLLESSLPRASYQPVAPWSIARTAIATTSSTMNTCFNGAAIKLR
jgi:hypothetical protein